MEENNTIEHSELLIKLTRLEDQVTALSSQLESSQLTISHLKQSISGRDVQIRQLESKLMQARRTLNKTAIDKIIQCREQIKNGIDVKIVHPVLTQVQAFIEAIERLIAESKEFISKRKMQLTEGVNVTTALVRQSPDQAWSYLDKSVFEPMTALYQRSVELSGFYYQKSRFWFEQELVKRCRTFMEDISFAARELSLNARIILQTRVINPVAAYVDKLPELLHNMSKAGIGWQQQALRKVNGFLQRGLEFMMELVKNSSFWDGKHRIQGAA